MQQRFIRFKVRPGNIIINLRFRLQEEWIQWSINSHFENYRGPSTFHIIGSRYQWWFNLKSYIVFLRVPYWWVWFKYLSHIRASFFQYFIGLILGLQLRLHNLIQFSGLQYKFFVIILQFNLNFYFQLQFTELLNLNKGLLNLRRRLEYLMVDR